MKPEEMKRMQKIWKEQTPQWIEQMVEEGKRYTALLNKIQDDREIRGE